MVGRPGHHRLLAGVSELSQAAMAGQAGFRLNIDRGTGIFSVSDDESFDLRLGSTFRSGTMAGFTHGNGRIRSIGDVQLRQTASLTISRYFQPEYVRQRTDVGNCRSRHCADGVGR